MSEMIKLFVLPSDRKHFNYSPFCLKAEAFLALTKIPHKVIHSGNMKATPKGMMPYIMDGEFKQGDSAFILTYLSQKYNLTLDAHLTQEEHAIGHMVRCMLEERFYFATLYSRWINDTSWPQVRKIFFSRVSRLMEPIAANLIRKRMAQRVYMQGIGRHSEEDIYALAKDDLRALHVILGHKLFLLGDKPTSYDCTVYGFLKNLIGVQFGSELEREASSYKNFAPYLKRMEEAMGWVNV